MIGFITVQNSSITLKWHSVTQWQRRNDLKIIDIPQFLIVHIHIKQPNKKKNPKAVEDCNSISTKSAF